MLTTWQKFMRNKMSDTMSDTMSDFKQLTAKNKWFVNKWCVNFLCMLIFYGGGQRPQVFTLMEAPAISALSEMAETAREHQYFELKVSLEKRVRSVELPNVLLPSKILRYVLFHVRHVLPYLRAQFKIAPSDARARYLLLHTRSGDVLDSANVTASLRKFLTRYDPNLAKVTTMTIRCCFASLMLRRFREKKAFPGMQEKEFISYLAKVMNTSEEQIRETYAASEREDFATVAAKLTMDIDEAGDTSDSEIEEDY